MLELANPGFAGDGNFIQAALIIFPVYHHYVTTAEAQQKAHEDADEIAVKNTNQLVFCACGIGQRSENIEKRAHAEVAAHRGGMLHGTVKIRGKHETEADFPQVLGDLIRRLLQIDAERFEHVRTSRFTGNGATAMLGDTCPRCCGDKSRSGGDIESMSRIPASATSIYKIALIRNLHTGDEFTHDLSSRGNFPDGFLFYPQAGDDSRDQRRRQLSFHDLTHERKHLIMKNLAMLDNSCQRFLRSHDDIILSQNAYGTQSIPMPAKVPINLLVQKIFQQLVAVLGQNGFRVKLNPLDGQGLMAHAHDFPIFAPCRDFQALRQGFTLDDK